MTENTIHCLVCGHTGDRGDFDSFIAATTSPGVRVDRDYPFCDKCCDSGRDASLILLKRVKVTETIGYEGPFRYHRGGAYRVMLIDPNGIDPDDELARVPTSDDAEAFIAGWVAAWERARPRIEALRKEVGSAIETQMPEPPDYDPRDDSSPGVW